MKLENLNVYTRSLDVGEEIWTLVSKWNFFEKDTMGKQIIRSADSIAANLSEGYGRFHFKESRHFGYYSRGSLFETKTWLVKAKNRKLVNDEKFEYLSNELEIIGKMLNAYIKSIGNP